MRDPEAPPLWKSLEEHAGTSRSKVLAEFSAIAAELDPVSRRAFLKWMGASLALAGIGACTRMPPEKIIPYITSPEYGAPGDSLFFASTLTLGGYGRGVLVRSNDGRPTKVEGNPLQGASLGASDIFMQGDLLNLYDPDRLKSVLHWGAPSDRSGFEAELFRRRAEWDASGGEGIALLTGTLTSPSMGDLLDKFLKKYPRAKWHSYEPIHSDFAREASLIAFGKDVLPIYKINRAKLVVSLDGDFLGPGPAQIPYAREFASSRRGDGFSKTPVKLWVAESGLTLTGAIADSRLAVKPSEMIRVGSELLDELLAQAGESSELVRPWVKEVLKLLRAHHGFEGHGESLIIAGERSPVELQVVARVLNLILGNVGSTVEYIPSPELHSTRHGNSLGELTEEMSKGVVKALFMLGVNPAYTAPSDLDFARALEKVPFRVQHSLHHDETSALCDWVLPAAHELESWGDARSWKGQVSLQQPLILPLYDGKTASEMLSVLLGSPASGREILENYWKGALSDQAIHDGVITGSEHAPVAVRLRSGWKKAITLPRITQSSQPGDLELRIEPDSTIWDGKYSNNGWLQELPKPLTQLTWDNAILISQKNAWENAVENGDEVELQSQGRSVRGPIWILPGHPDGSLTISLGYGRHGRGLDANRIRTVEEPYFQKGVRLKRTGKSWKMACTQSHQSMDSREPIRTGTFLEPPQGDRDARPSLLADFISPPSKEAWGMVIDLSACIGCKACTIACQAENNIPVVGKEQVLNFREMHWIRVDRYFGGSLGNPSDIRIYFQPVPCMHCEKAPCELVCPTAATNHSSDGLNQMVYNRCVGTRYCSNNCPYKVRRFNFFQFSDAKSPLPRMMYNPEVTVRSRGVMEKCSYCIQRIQNVRIEAEKEDRPIRDAEIKTACQQACPTEAIVFGNLNDPNSRVLKLRNSRLNYSLLGELGTKPRTTYLPHLRVDPGTST